MKYCVGITVLTVAFALNATKPAHAGEWAVGYEGSTVMSGTGWTGGQFNLVDGGYPNTCSLGENGLFGDAVSNGGTVNASWNGTLHPVLYWEPSDPNDLPPVDVALKVYAGCSAYISYGTEFGPGPITMSMNNGWENYVDQTVQPTQRLGKWHIIRYNNSARDAIIHMAPTHIVANVSIPANAAATGSLRGIDAYAIYDLQIDNRSVKLTRGVGDKEEFKLEGGEWHTYGDSIYSAHNEDGIPDVISNIPIEALYGGQWSWGANEGYGVTSVWTPAGFENILTEGWRYLYGKAKYGTPTLHRVDPFIFDYHGTPTGAQQFVTKYKTTDNGDNASINSYYHLTLHDPVEKFIPDEFWPFTVEAPMRNEGSDLWWGPNDWMADQDRPKVKIASSTVYGYALKATTEIKRFKSLLGLSAEYSYESKSTVEVTQEKTVPKIPAGKYRYLKAFHPFQRRHSRFYAYDESGKIKRMVTKDWTGNVFNPPVEAPHEAIEDNPGVPIYDFSEELDSHLTDSENLPRVPAPDPEPSFDFS